MPLDPDDIDSDGPVYTQPLIEKIAGIFGSVFTWTRGYSSYHKGLDLGAARGTPVRSIASGKVVYAADTRLRSRFIQAPWYTIGGGNVVLVDTGNGIIEEYAHLDSINVRAGQIVTKDQLLGAVGSTGDATGPHLHFATFDKSKNAFTDPGPLLGYAGLNYLGAWNNIVQLEEGKTLTVEDVDNMIKALDAAHFFHSGLIHDPIGNALAENAARDKTRQVLLSHVGEAWNKELQDKLQAELYLAADEATNTPGADIGKFLMSLSDPITWFKVVAVVLGVILLYKGGITIVKEGSGTND